MGKKNVAYFYNEDIGNYHYGPGHPMKPHRVRMTHDLIQSYGLLEMLDLFVPIQPTISDLTCFHADDYVDFLREVNTENIKHFGDQMYRFNVGEDCPVFDGLWEFCNIYTGGSIGGVQSLMRQNYDTAINWAGGLHHGKKHEASGFCYLNDCVLGALEFLKYKFRVLYVDIDVHHGDGVEEAFYCSPRVMCCSFHKYGDYFPGTGALDDIGVEEGVGYSVNVPLKDGTNDATFIEIFNKVIPIVMSQYRPEAIILQSGADSLSGDRLGCFNLSLTGHSYAVAFLRQYGIPMLVVGGGGYTLRNVPKCWVNETAIIVGKELPHDIPISAEFYGYYGPDFVLQVDSSGMENKNDQKYLDDIVQVITENFRQHVYPVGDTLSANSTSSITEFYRKYDDTDHSLDKNYDTPLETG